MVFGGPEVGRSGLLALSSLNGTNGFKIDGEFPGDQCGYSVSAAGDINGDGHDDVLVGAPGYASNTGRVYVVFGGPGVGNSGTLALTGLNGANGFKLDGEVQREAFGSLIAAGDVNNDGYFDLLIGVQSSDRCYLVLGGPQVGGNGMLALSSLNGTNGFKVTTAYYGSISSLGMGDVNGDGYADLLIGARGPLSNAGQTYLVFGDHSPQIWVNRLTIHAGETVVLTTDNFNATGNVVVTFSIFNVQHGHFQLLTNPGQTMTQFNQSQVLNGQIQFIHDGSQFAPSYAVQATSRIAISTLQVATITFYRKPTVLFNELSINQGQKVLISSNFLNLIDDYPISQVNLTISNLQHGQFQLAPLNYSCYAVWCTTTAE